MQSKIRPKFSGWMIPILKPIKINTKTNSVWSPLRVPERLFGKSIKNFNKKNDVETVRIRKILNFPVSHSIKHKRNFKSQSLGTRNKRNPVKKQPDPLHPLS